jgi:hypothetical protein
MAQRLHPIELRQTGFGDDFQRFASRIRQEMQMKFAQSENPLWKSMGKSLAEASGCFQGKDSSPLFGIDPQLGEHWKSSTHNL